MNGGKMKKKRKYDELYEHRVLLYINLCLLQPERCAWRPDYKDWFVLYLETDFGQISYHCPVEFLSVVKGAIKRADDYTFVPHTSKDVANRLKSMAANWHHSLVGDK